MQPLLIRSAQGDYPVEFHATLAPLIDQLARIERTAVVIDAEVARRYPALAEALARRPLLRLEANEDRKSLPTVCDILSFLQAHEATHDTTLVAIGGGIIQDVAALAAHLYYRGLGWICVPTTLLAMSDSCIGAKAGVNFSGFKNQIGCFHSPARVLLTLAFAGTLTDCAIRSGYGEILKLSLTDPTPFFDQVHAALDAGPRAETSLAMLVRRSLAVKARVIEIDEYDTGLRRTLNYGHTFGHAIEAASQHEIPHGVAVAWGLDMANWIAVTLGWLAPIHFRAIHDVVAKHFRIALSHPISVDDLLAAIRRDKKMAGDSISLVLLREPGRLEIVPTPLTGALPDAVGSYLDRFGLPAAADQALA